MRPTAAEWSAAAWAIQTWIRSCFDVVGVCSLCGTPDPRAHVNGCPWPQTRGLLDREVMAELLAGRTPANPAD